MCVDLVEYILSTGKRVHNYQSGYILSIYMNEIQQKNSENECDFLWLLSFFLFSLNCNRILLKGSNYAFFVRCLSPSCWKTLVQN